MKALLSGHSTIRRTSASGRRASASATEEATTTPPPAPPSTPPSFSPQLLAWSGVPAAADALAYSDGGWLAFSCPDGRCLVAAPPDGREVALSGPTGSQHRTLGLVFLPGGDSGSGGAPPAGLVRATPAGLEAWALSGAQSPPASRACLPAPTGGPVTTLALVPPDDGGAPPPTTHHLLLVGRADGAVAAARVACGGGGGATLAWTGYELSPATDFGGAAGPVTALALGKAAAGARAGAGARILLLAAHARAGATAWDLSGSAPLACLASPDVSALAWLTPGLAFVTGHTDGRVRGWGVPAARRAGGAACAAGPPATAHPLWTLLRDAPPAGGFGPVRGLHPVHPPPPGTPAALAVWGSAEGEEGEEEGKGEEEGEGGTGTGAPGPRPRASPPASPPAGGVALLLSGDLSSPTPLITTQAAPWFGPVRGVLVCGDAAAGAPPALLVLSSGGLVTAHDPASGLSPAPVGLPSQALPQVTVAVLCGGGGREVSGGYARASAARGVNPASAGWRVPLAAWRAGWRGPPAPAPAPAPALPARPGPPPPSGLDAILFTGHVDGRLRVWTAPPAPSAPGPACRWSGPVLLDASPWGGHGGHGRPRPV